MRFLLTGSADFSGTAALLAAMSVHRARRRVLASSMAVYGEGRYVCETHGDRVPPPRSRAGAFENHCAVCGGALTWGPVTESARLDPRSSYAASKVGQQRCASGWARQADATASVLRYYSVYGPHMPADPYSGVAGAVCPTS